MPVSGPCRQFRAHTSILFLLPLLSSTCHPQLLPERAVCLQGPACPSEEGASPGPASKTLLQAGCPWLWDPPPAYPGRGLSPKVAEDPRVCMAWSLSTSSWALTVHPPYSQPPKDTQGLRPATLSTFCLSSLSGGQALIHVPPSSRNTEPLPCAPCPPHVPEALPKHPCL